MFLHKMKGERKMKKLFAILLVLAMMFGVISCGGGTPASSPPPSASSGSAAPEASASPPPAKSSRDLVYEIIEKDPLGLNGIPPNRLEDRSHVNKGLPVEKKGNLTIGMSVASVGSAFFTTMLNTLEEELNKLGHTFIFQVSDRNIELQIQQVDAFISQGVDLIIFNGAAQAHTATFKKSADAGIPILVTSNQAAEWDGCHITDILAGSYEAGWRSGEYTGRHMYEKDTVYKIGFILNSIGSADTESRANGFISGFQYALRELDGNPYASKWDAIYEGYHVWREFMDNGKLLKADARINLVGYGNGETPDAPGGQKAANDLVAGNRDMDLLFIETDNMWAGVEVVLRQNSLKPGEDLIISCAADATKVGLEAIMNGEILAISNNSSAMNAMGMVEIIRGLFEEGYSNRDYNNLVANTYTPTVCITKENVEQFYDPDQDLARGIPYDFKTVPEHNANLSDTSDPF